MKFSTELRRIARRYARRAIDGLLRNAEREVRKKLSRGSSADDNAVEELADQAKREASERKQTKRQPARTTEHGVAPVKWNFAQRGLPDFAYAPDNDALPDPGEIVWTWVPFEEDPTQGKDRPVLVLSARDGEIVFAALTSKNHANDGEGLYQDEYGRWWLDIGTGDWDSEHRASEVRLDTLWTLSETDVRRVGGTLDRSQFGKVVSALREIHDGAW